MQLQHDETETSWEDHGWVKVIGADGTVLCEEAKVQHNRSYSERVALLEKMVGIITAKLEAAASTNGSKTAAAAAGGDGVGSSVAAGA